MFPPFLPGSLVRCGETRIQSPVSKLYLVWECSFRLNMCRFFLILPLCRLRGKPRNNSGQDRLLLCMQGQLLHQFFNRFLFYNIDGAATKAAAIILAPSTALLFLTWSTKKSSSLQLTSYSFAQPVVRGKHFCPGLISPFLNRHRPAAGGYLHPPHICEAGW